MALAGGVGGGQGREASGLSVELTAEGGGVEGWVGGRAIRPGRGGGDGGGPQARGWGGGGPRRWRCRPRRACREKSPGCCCSSEPRGRLRETPGRRRPTR